MSGEKKYYRTVVEVEILSDEPWPDITDLDTIHYAITEGDASGMVNTKESHEVTAEEMAVLLTAQGSDPGFLIREEDDE